MHSKEWDQLRQRIEIEPKLFCNVKLRGQVYLSNEVDGKRKLNEDEVLHQSGISEQDPAEPSLKG